MKHGLVSMSDCDFFSQYDLSFCDLVDSSGKIAADQAWNALMGERGFAINHEVDTLHELFLLICSEFAITYNRKYSIIAYSLRPPNIIMITKAFVNLL